MADDPIRRPASADLPRLIERLAEAEAALAEAIPGNVDAIVHPSGHSYLLKEAQRVLLQSEARAKEHAALLDAVLQSATEHITYVGLDGKVLWANRTPAANAALGDAEWLACASPEHRAELSATFERVIATGTPESHESSGCGPSGRTAWFSRRFAPVRREGLVIGVVIVTRDVTEQKTAQSQLMAADRMASVGTLAAGVAHEINNPLTAVGANVDLLLRGLHDLAKRGSVGTEMIEEARDALEATERIRQIVRDLRIFARSEEDKVEAVDVEAILESTLRIAWNEIRHRAHLVKDYGNVPFARGNDGRLGQVFLNLVVNAAQAIPEGSANRNVIRVATTHAPGDRVVVTISDTGVGMTEDVQSRLFTPFFTTKAAGIGTGLGLSICRRIVSALGGEITFESVHGKGTTFRVVLPVAVDGLPSLTTPEADLKKGAGGRGRILVVDDELPVGMVARRILATDHEVTVVYDGERALELLRSGQAFDVILCDVMMPNMTGMELYTEVEKLDAALAARFVFMTGGAFTPWAKEFLDSVENRRIEKPFDSRSLRAIVNELVR